MPESEQTLSEITSIYLAKRLAPHLKTVPIRVPLSAKIRLSPARIIWSIIFGTAGTIVILFFLLRHPKEYLEERKYAKENKKAYKRWGEFTTQLEKEEEERLKNTGITTREEENALVVATFAGLCFGRIICHADNDGGFFPLEVTKTKLTPSGALVVEEIRMDEKAFKKIVAASIKDGIVCLEDPYYGMPLYKGMPRQFNTLNPDFEEKATNILLEEIHQRIDGGTEVTVLKNIAVKKDSDGKIYMKRIWRPVA